MAWGPRGDSLQARLVVFLVVLTAPAAGSRRAALCRPPCGPGGLCLPTRGLGRASWRCHCRHPWRGPTCGQLAEDTSLWGGSPGDEGAGAAGGGEFALEQEERRQLPVIFNFTNNTTTTTTTPNLEDLSGRAENDSGDMEKFMFSLVLNSGLVCGIALAFSVLRQWFPVVYCERLVPERRKDEVPDAPKLSDGFFSWFWAACWDLRVDDIRQYAGLDHAMYIDYTQFAMKLLTEICVPFWILLVPLHICCGGGKAQAIGDTLSMQGLNNVVDGNWLWKVHAFVTWYVTGVTLLRVRMAQERFTARRMQWLKEMHHTRATTLLIENLPDGEVNAGTEIAETKFAELEDVIFGKHESEKIVDSARGKLSRKLNTPDALAKYLNHHVSRSATRPEHVFIVKRESAIVKLQEVLSRIEHCRQIMKEQESHSGLSPEHLKGKAVELIHLHTPRSKKELLDDIARMEVEAANMRADINRDQTNQTNSTVAFVRFATRRDAVICLKLFSEDDNEEIVASMPKGSVEDIIWADLCVDEVKQGTLRRTGVLLLIAVFMTFAPAVLFIVSISKFASLASVVPELHDLKHFGKAWDGLVGTTMLTLLMGMIPQVFMKIFTQFFVVQDASRIQLKLHQLYYQFLVIFVMFLSAVGTSLTDTVIRIMVAPATFFFILAEELPPHTHFYINYFHSQWMACAMQLLRLAPLVKFVSWSKVLGSNSKAAKEKAEPEDQGSQGMGARSALASLNMTISLTLCSVSPLAPVMGFVYFAINRVVYGYLFSYCESYKGDMGGDFFVTQLEQTLEALFLYIAFMTGLIYLKTNDMVFTLIAAGNFYLLWEAIRVSKRDFRWEIMEFSDLEELKEEPNTEEDPYADHYRQPELRLPTDRTSSNELPAGAQAAPIAHGTRLQAAQDALVFKSPESWDVLRKLAAGEEVRAAGAPLVCAGFPMVALIGGGAVELDYLHIIAEP